MKKMPYIYFILLFLSYKCYSMDIREKHSNVLDFNVVRAIDKYEIDKYPHNSVLPLTAEFKIEDSVRKRIGTCFSIGGGFALTAAHVVVHEGVPASKIVIHRGLHGDNTLGASSRINITNKIEVKKYVYSGKYKPKDDKLRLNNISNDYALIYAEELKNITPIIPVYYYERPINELFLCGYPGEGYKQFDRDHGDGAFPYEVKAKFHEQTKWTVSFKTPSFGGMSGSPIRFTDDGKKWKTTAILSGETEDGGTGITYGCLLTQHTIDNIDLWKEALNNSSNHEQFSKALPFSKWIGFDKGEPYYVGKD